MGRPTNFDPEISAALIVAVLGGAARKDAAALAGISPSALFSWLAQGRKGDVRYASFTSAVAEAERQFRRARRARAAATVLRRRPRRSRAE